MSANPVIRSHKAVSGCQALYAARRDRGKCMSGRRDNKMLLGPFLYECLVPTDTTQVYIARQPIFDRNLDVAFHELLYRSDAHADVAHVVNKEQATSELLVNSLIEIGLDRIASKERVFINFTREYIVGDWALPLAPRRVGLELLENETPDARLVDALRERAKQGFMIALDDFIYEPQYDPLLKVAHIVKLDVLALGEEGLRDQVEILKRFPVKLLAEKVETHTQFDLCRSLGFDYFQGFFISQPELLSGTGLRTSRYATLQLLSEVQDPDISLSRLEEVLSQDVALSYKLLRYINSAFFNLSRELKTVRQALVYMGLRALRAWASLVIVLDADDRPHALKELALTRARFCYCLAERLGEEDTGPFFTVGLFSTLDALLGQPMQEVLGSLPLSDETKDALINHSGRVGHILRCAVEHERGQWSECEDLPLTPSEVTEAYCEALAWTEDLMQLTRG